MTKREPRRRSHRVARSLRGMRDSDPALLETSSTWSDSAGPSDRDAPRPWRRDNHRDLRRNHMAGAQRSGRNLRNHTQEARADRRGDGRARPRQAPSDRRLLTHRQRRQAPGGRNSAPRWASIRSPRRRPAVTSDGSRHCPAWCHCRHSQTRRYRALAWSRSRSANRVTIPTSENTRSIQVSARSRCRRGFLGVDARGWILPNWLPRRILLFWSRTRSGRPRLRRKSL
jgi:hypothetical protein